MFECVIFYSLAKEEGYYGRESSTVGTWRMLEVKQVQRNW